VRVNEADGCNANADSSPRRTRHFVGAVPMQAVRVGLQSARADENNIASGRA